MTNFSLEVLNPLVLLCRFLLPRALKNTKTLTPKFLIKALHTHVRFFFQSKANSFSTLITGFSQTRTQSPLIYSSLEDGKAATARKAFWEGARKKWLRNFLPSFHSADKRSDRVRV